MALEKVGAGGDPRLHPLESNASVSINNLFRQQPNEIGETIVNAVRAYDRTSPEFQVNYGKAVEHIQMKTMTGSIRTGHEALGRMVSGAFRNGLLRGDIAPGTPEFSYMASVLLGSQLEDLQKRSSRRVAQIEQGKVIFTDDPNRDFREENLIKNRIIMTDITPVMQRVHRLQSDIKINLPDKVDLPIALQALALLPIALFDKDKQAIATAMRRRDYERAGEIAREKLEVYRKQQARNIQ